MKNENNRIKYALYLNGWNYEGGDKQKLKTEAKKIIPSEFTSSMSGNIFCPGCYTNLSKSPKDKQKFVNGRSACFIHLPTYRHIECDLRTPKPEGIQYPTEELAKQAISDGQLAIIDSFRITPPESVLGDSAPYGQSAVEDFSGPISDIPISRHKGENFKLPSKISTVAGICRNFDENLYKYYVFPGEKIAKRLSEKLINIADVENVDDHPKLYYGEIIHSRNAGITPKPTNLRMTQLQCNNKVKDFYLKAIESEQSEKGIRDDSKGRIVIFWGKITESGIGLCVKGLGWGEYALLPEKYNEFLR